MSARCPAETDLIRFASGVATDAERSEVERHLDQCSDCRRVVAVAAADHTLAPPAVPISLAPGQRIGGYRVGVPLGQGGMGVVYEGLDERLGRSVALKLLRTPDAPDNRERLLREARSMARLNHPHVVALYELGEWEGGLFLSMECVDGEALSTWRASAGRSFADKLRVLLEAGRGLAAAHAAGIVHRDFKPANVLVGRDGRARVTDFGLSRLGGGADTEAGQLIGTPAYMAPEQWQGRAADARSDQFAFCVTVVETLTGRRPFPPAARAERLQQRTPPPALGGVPRHLRAPLRRGLSERPESRYPSMEPLLTALAARPPRWKAAAAAATLGLVAASGAWQLREPEVTVLVSTVDLDEGARLTRGELTRRAVPANMVTSSVIRPEHEAFIIDQPLVVPVRAGDMLLWTQFERKRSAPQR